MTRIGRALSADERTARAFRTRQVDDPKDFVRTYGAFVLGGSGSLSSGDWVAAVERARLDVPANCARGKLAVVGEDDDGWTVRAHQLADHGTRGDVVACSNATAAAARVVTEMTGVDVAELGLDLPDAHAAAVTATVTRESEAVSRVDQRWTGVGWKFERDTVVDGRTCVRGVGALNHYLVVRTRDATDLASISLEDAIRLSHHFRHDAEPLRSRVAFVHTDNNQRSARFFTCDQREHPSAPLTGLAVLALAAGIVDWLTPSTWVSVSVGAMRPPAVAWAHDGTATIEFPPILVDLEAVS